jgi:hypothetical protein
VRLGIGKREGRAPRAADEKPFADAEVRPNALQIGDNMLSAVGMKRQVGVASPGAALVEQQGAKSVGVEQSAVIVLGAASWSAVQEQRRNTIGATDLLHVDPMAVADVEHAGIVGAPG